MPRNRRLTLLFLVMLFIMGCRALPTPLPTKILLSPTPLAHTATPAPPTFTPSPLPTHEPTLVKEMLQSLTIALTALYPVQLTPGSSYDFELGTIECCYFLIPVEADVTWSVKPEAGAEIDPTEGTLRIDKATPPGSIFIVTANVENGRWFVSTNVYVYTREANPLIGTWRETNHHTCGDDEWVLSEFETSNATSRDDWRYVPMGELAFNADGTFKATWFPLEIFYDYSGTYTYDLDQGRLELNFSEERGLPKDLDSSGSFSFDKGKLVLEDLWLGNNWRKGEPAGCGYIFSRP